MSGRVGGIVTG